MTRPMHMAVREAAGSRILAIDPGPENSAWVEWEDGELVDFGIATNGGMLGVCSTAVRGTVVVIEQIRSMGMAVGAEVFDTVHWSGRFDQASLPNAVVLIPRHKVKSHLCGNQKAKDQNIRQALIDRFGGSTAIRKGGPLYGVSKDVWSALALAVTYADGGHL